MHKHTREEKNNNFKLKKSLLRVIALKWRPLREKYSHAYTRTSYAYIMYVHMNEKCQKQIWRTWYVFMKVFVTFYNWISFIGWKRNCFILPWMWFTFCCFVLFKFYIKTKMNIDCFETLFYARKTQTFLRMHSLLEFSEFLLKAFYDEVNKLFNCLQF